MKTWVAERKAQEGGSRCHSDTKRPAEKVLCHVLARFSFQVDLNSYALLRRKRDQNTPTQTSRKAFLHKNKRIGSPKKERREGLKEQKQNKDRSGLLNCQISVLWAGILKLHTSRLAVWWQSEISIGGFASFFFKLINAGKWVIYSHIKSVFFILLNIFKIFKTLFFLNVFMAFCFLSRQRRQPAHANADQAANT